MTNDDVDLRILLEIFYNARFVEFTSQLGDGDRDFSYLNRKSSLDEVRSLCQEHQICADLYSLSDNNFVGSVLETGLVISSLSRYESQMGECDRK